MSTIIGKTDTSYATVSMAHHLLSSLDKNVVQSHGEQKFSLFTNTKTEITIFKFPRMHNIAESKKLDDI